MSDWISNTLQPNGVLKNKLGINNEEELQHTEYMLSSIAAFKLAKKHPKIKSIDDLKKIHKLMFDKLYDWAGKNRPGNFQKDDTVFFPCEMFDMAELDLNNHLASFPKKPKAEDYAQLLDEINYYHPFREGNGRSTKVFLQCLAANRGQALDYPRKNDEMIEAQNKSDIKSIAKLIKVDDTAKKTAAFNKMKELYLDPTAPITKQSQMQF